MYVVAPLAVKVVVIPAQIVALFTVKAGVELTDTVDTIDDVHPPDVPVIV